MNTAQHRTVRAHTVKSGDIISFSPQTPRLEIMSRRRHDFTTDLVFLARQEGMRAWECAPIPPNDYVILHVSRDAR